MEIGNLMMMMMAASSVRWGEDREFDEDDDDLC